MRSCSHANCFRSWCGEARRAGKSLAAVAAACLCSISTESRITKQQKDGAPPLALEGCTDGALFPRGPRAGAQRLAPLNLLSLPASLLTIAFTGQRLLNAQFLARLQVKGMSLDFPDYVLLQDLPLEALERVLKRLALLEPYLSQIAPPTLTRIPIRVRAGTFSINRCFVILSKSTCFGIPKPGSRGLFFRIEVHHVRAALALRRTQKRRLCWERRYYSISVATGRPLFRLGRSRRFPDRRI